MKTLAMILVLVLAMVGCVTTTTTLPDGTVIEEKAPDMAAIMQAMTFAEAALDRIERQKATAAEYELIRLEAQQAQWQDWLETLAAMADRLEGARTTRQLGRAE